MGGDHGTLPPLLHLPLLPNHLHKNLWSTFYRNDRIILCGKIGHKGGPYHMYRTNEGGVHGPDLNQWTQEVDGPGV